MALAQTKIKQDHVRSRAEAYEAIGVPADQTQRKSTKPYIKLNPISGNLFPGGPASLQRKAVR